MKTSALYATQHYMQKALLVTQNTPSDTVFQCRCAYGLPYFLMRL